MADELFRFEDIDAIRMTWNIWPRNKVDAAKCVVPFAALYTPVKPRPDLTVVQYEPVRCKSCAAVLNLHAQVDFHSKLWICPICQVRNHFPSHYQGIGPDLLPAELFANNSTIEYTMQRQATVPPVYIFVVDVSVSEDELEACKTTLVQALTMMPEHCYIGLVTFGTHVHVHELMQNDLPKSYVFRGSGEYSAVAVAAQLGVHRGRQQGAVGISSRFIVPLGECEFNISQALEDVQKDAYQAVSDHRPSRCTGTALQVASGLAASTLPPNGGAVKIMLFVGGPCTDGKAAIVPKELHSEIRSHKDLVKDAAPLWRPAIRFYEQLSSQLVANAHSLDVFACALEQSGLAEMKPVVQATGGLVVQTDTFRNPVFKDSLTRVFASEGGEGFLGTCSCATLDVMCSRDIKLQGLLGTAASADKASPAVSSNRIGASGTASWKLCSLDHTTTACVVFDITADKDERPDGGAGGQQLYLQFITTYLHWDGTVRCRVTTVSRLWTDGANPIDMVSGFDQEAAAVVMARIVTHKMECEEDFDANRWLDRNLIRLAQRFGEYRKDEPETFMMLSEMAFFPSFMFHLRRSQFVQVFGSSPDETAFARICLMKEHARHGILMIQPQLFAFSMNGPPEPVPLDVASIVPDRILFLDSYFYIVVFHGGTIAQWRAEGFQDNPEYPEFAALLREPQEKAQAIVRTRFPVPRFVDADNHTVQGRSQGRFLLVKLNPSSTHISSGAANAGEIIYTEDVSLEVFLEHLKKLAVQS